MNSPKSLADDMGHILARLENGIAELRDMRTRLDSQSAKDLEAANQRIERQAVNFQSLRNDFETARKAYAKLMKEYDELKREKCVNCGRRWSEVDPCSIGLDSIDGDPSEAFSVGEDISNGDDKS